MVSDLSSSTNGGKETRRQKSGKSAISNSFSIPKKDFEVLVIDNNSKDETAAYCSTISSQYPGLNFRYVSETNGDIVALDIQNGATYWLQTDLQGRRLSKPAIMGKYLVIADEDGFVHWIDKSSGKLAGRFKVNSRGVEATPIVNNNIVYILGCSGKLVALEVN